MRIAPTLDMCLWRCWCSGPMQWYWTNQWTDGASYTSSIRQRAITGTHATKQTCRWCLTIFRVESASFIQGTYELLLFVHCSTLKSVTSHKSKGKEIHLQLFMDFNVEQCRVRLMWLKTRWCQLKLAHLSEKLGLLYSKDLSNWKSVHHQTWHTCLYASVPAYCLVLWVSLHLLWSHPSPAPTSHILISPLVHTLSWFTVAMLGHHGEREYYLGCSVEKKRSMTCRIVEIISVWWVCWCGQRDRITFSFQCSKDGIQTNI